MVPQAAFKRLQKELNDYYLQEVTDCSGVNLYTIQKWCSAHPPRFPHVHNFIKVCEAIGLEIEITVK